MAEFISREFALSCVDNFLSKTDMPIAAQYFYDCFRECKAADAQPVRHGQWITKAKDYYKAWQDSGRSWDDMPYFVTGLKFACSNCFEQFDVNAEGVEKWNGCPLCLARMDGDVE